MDFVRIALRTVTIVTNPKYKKIEAETLFPK